jgi:hypothetical protein
MEKYICIAIAILIAILFLGMFTTVSYENYAKKECRVEGMKANKTPNEIKKICQ